MQDTENSNHPAKCSAILAQEFSRCSLDIISDEGSQNELGYTFYSKGKPHEAKRESIKSEITQKLDEFPQGV